MAEQIWSCLDISSTSLATNDVYCLVPAEVDSHNVELASILSPVHETLATETTDTTEMAEIFTTLLSYHLIQQQALKPPPRCPLLLLILPVTHCSRSVVKLTWRLTEMKNRERRNFTQNPRSFTNAWSTHHKPLKASKEQEVMWSTRKQEWAFR